MINVRIQADDFDPGAEIERLHQARSDIGAVASFVGLVRGDGIDALTLEHYPGMTERQIESIARKAVARWPIQASTIIHRHGRLTAGERIIFVAVASRHRAAAFEACAFLMDWLKTKAPFWKREEFGGTSRWVEAKASDDLAADRWLQE